MKLVETEQDVPKTYLYCHKRDTQGINYQYPKINKKSVLFYVKQFITRTSLCFKTCRAVFFRDSNT